MQATSCEWKILRNLWNTLMLAVAVAERCYWLVCMARRDFVGFLEMYEMNAPPWMICCNTSNWPFNWNKLISMPLFFLVVNKEDESIQGSLRNWCMPHRCEQFFHIPSCTFFEHLWYFGKIMIITGLYRVLTDSWLFSKLLFREI